MSVYFVASYTVADPEKYPKYVEGVVPLLEKHGAEILVADYEAKPVEGEPAGVTVVLRFDSEEKAMAWYDDPEYQPVRQIRFDTTTGGRGVLARHYVPPEG